MHATSTTPSALPTLRSPRVLLLDSDTEHAEAIAAYLSGDDVDVLLAHCAEAGASRLRTGPADLVITRGSMLSEIERLHSAGMLPESCPVIALCEGEAEDRARALRRGCIDALSLPVHSPELAERMRLALERSTTHTSARIEAIEVTGGLRLVPQAREVTVHGQRVELSRLELELLWTLAREPERVFTKAELMIAIWGYESNTSRTLDSHACRLRLKLDEAGGNYILNKWGVGYRLMPLT